MLYEKEVFVDLEQINKYLTQEPTCETECLGEDQTITETVIFDNGLEMDIKCCGVQFREGESNLAWTEAVLFQDGSEIACTDVRDALDGDWKLEDDEGNTYIAHIKSK